jgi:hypothetical protein
MKHEIFLDFCIWKYEDINADEITHTLGIKPSKIYIKGEKTSPKLSILAKENGWRMSSGMDKHSSFEEHLDAILNIIEPKINLFKPFCDKYYCEFACAIYIRYNNEESIPWLHLNDRYNNLIKSLKIEFDLDLYCLPND